MSDLDVLKEIPGYKAILKSVLKSQIQLLMEQLSEHTGEESIILTASVHDGSLSHLGSNTGKGFLEGRDEIKSQFLGYCLKTYHKKKTHEPQKPYQRTHPSPRSPAQLPTPPAKRPRVHPVSISRASPAEIYSQSSEIPSEVSDSNVGLRNTGAIADSIIKTEQFDHQSSDIPENEQMAESDESVTFTAAEKSIPESIHLSHTQTTSAAGEMASEMDSAQEKIEAERTEMSDLSGIKVEQVEDELEITGVEMAAGNLDNWGQGHPGYGAESDNSFDQSVDQSGYNHGHNAESRNLSNKIKDETTEGLLDFPSMCHIDEEVSQVKSTEYLDSENDRSEIEKNPVKVEDMAESEQGEVTTSQNLPDYMIVLDNSKFACGLCPKKFTVKGNLKRHIVNWHQIDINGQGHKCDHCSKVHLSRSELREHIRTHNGPPLMCEICSKVFKTRSGLDSHLKMHKNIYKFACKVCGKGYNDKHLFEGHTARHRGEKSHKCEKCGKVFQYYRNMTTHSKDCGETKKKFICETCGALFKCKSYLKDHEIAHTNPKRYKCEHCGERFKHRSAFYKHINISGHK